MNENKFFVGLDVGTNSVGWAATDENYDLLRLKGKTAWGAHIFPEAESAGKRRLFRTSGRRLARRKRRIDLLNRLFEPLLKNQDENFLNRLEESAYILEDKKSEKTVHSLFGNKKLEKDFYTKYPTIWHLRKDMCDDKKEAFNDIRFVYLAVHHIIKYRGNFLLSGNIDPTKFDYSIFDGINAYFKDLVQEKSDEDINENFIFITPENSKKIVNILQGKESNKNSKKKILKELINDNETIEPFIQFFISLIVGGDFGVEKLGEEFSQFEKQKINITNFDEKRDDYLEMLGDKFLIVEYAKTIYDYVSLQEIIKGRPNLASAFANVYDSHQTQLKELKKLARLIDEKKGLAKTEKSMFYRLFYKKDEKNNYAAFVKHNTNESKKTSIHAFNKFVLEEISQHEGLLEENKTWLKLKKLAENDNLCETISRKSTSVIPHQLHENELVIILDNAAKRFPYIEEIKTKILKIFTFRIPYYCGPLNTQSSYSHVVKFEGKEKTVVLPWNFDEVVDKEKTRSKFMGSLTNECTYLIGENVLPRQSVIYQDYIIFNRLNSLIINGRACDQKTKMDVFYNLISKNKKTTINGLKKYLSQRYEIYKKDGVVISGLNENDDFNSESRALFSKHFDLSNHLEFKKVERIIYLLTIYSDDSNDALEVIEKENQKLTVEQKRFIKNFKSKGWGNLSGFLLQKLKWCDENAVCNSIYDLLKDTTENFMQILNNPLYDFKNIIAEKNEEKLKDLFDEDIVDEIIQKAPPKTRRSIISTIKIVDELVKVRKRTPDVISIEVTRGEEKKQKGKDGKEKAREKEVSAFLNSLKTCKEDFLDIPNLQTELSELDEKLSLKGKHIYLYFEQAGIDVYTGKRIDINDVIDSTKYDIDHIIPRRLIKDDSLDNLVLVSREQNQEIKGGLYPLPPSIRNNLEIKKIWKFLHKQKAFSDKKYNNLIRAIELTDDELSDFINAQINVVNHSNKILKDIFTIKYPDCKLIFSKARFPSLLRQRLEMPKLRDLNETHHAVDAYLNIVTGTILQRRFGNMDLIKKRSTMNEDEQRETFNLEGYLLSRILKNETKTPLGDKIFNNSQRHDFLLTYRKSYQDNAFYNMTIKKARESKTPVPIHTASDNPLSKTEVYGSYEGRVPEYHLVATIEKETKNKKKISKVLVPVYHLDSSLYKDDEKRLRKDIEAKMKLNANEKLVDLNTKLKIYPNQKIKVAGCHYLLCTKNEIVVNLKPIDPIFLDLNTCIYLSLASKKISSDEKLNLFADENYEFFTDKNRNNKFSINKNQNEKILLLLISLAKMKKYDFYILATKIRHYDCEESLAIFRNLKIIDQIGILESLINLFGRKNDNSKKFINDKFTPIFLKSKALILNENEVFLINDSVTGLFTNKIKL